MRKLISRLTNSCLPPKIRPKKNSDVAKKRIVRIGNVKERGLLVGDPYGKYSEPVSESCVMSAA